MLSLRTLALLPVLGAFLASSCGGGPRLETVAFTSGGGQRVELKVEIADTPEKMVRGLMFRERLPEDQGMLFDFAVQTQAPFWMKDTSIPLSIAFISADGLIIDIQDMQPFSEELHRSPQPYRLAVEVNQGWFQEHGIKIGDTLLRQVRL